MSKAKRWATGWLNTEAGLLSIGFFLLGFSFATGTAWLGLVCALLALYMMFRLAKL